MINYSPRQEVQELRAINAELQKKLERTEALLAYTAMMADVDLPEEDEEDE